MKLCLIDSCNNKHHGKGYCKPHYNEFILKPRLIDTKCSVENCENKISMSWTKLQLCDKHGTRLKRHGSVEERTRAREIASIIDELKVCDNPFIYEMPNRNTWAQIAKIIYGNTCMRCGWDKGTCDVHHKIYHGKGGKNILSNAEVVCPNCHRLEHQRESSYYSEETKQLILHTFNIRLKAFSPIIGERL